MQDQHVHVLEAQAREGPVDGGVARLVHARPQLGGHEQLLAVNTALGDGAAHGLLVHVGVRGVDMLVTRLERRERYGLGLRRGHQEGAQALDGHLDAVVELQILHGLPLSRMRRGPSRPRSGRAAPVSVHPHSGSARQRSTMPGRYPAMQYAHSEDGDPAGGRGEPPRARAGRTGRAQDLRQVGSAGQDGSTDPRLIPTPSPNGSRSAAHRDPFRPRPQKAQATPFDPVPKRVTRTGHPRDAFGRLPMHVHLCNSRPLAFPICCRWERARMPGAREGTE